MTINGTTYIECTFELDGEIIYGIYVHDENDVNHDGDGVIGNVDLPEDENDAAVILSNETMITDYDVLETVRFKDRSTPKDYVW